MSYKSFFFVKKNMVCIRNPDGMQSNFSRQRAQNFLLMSAGKAVGSFEFLFHV